MPFERFKAKHGGMGPLQAFYSELSGGEGFFGQWRPSFVRDRVGQTLDAIAGDDGLPEAFKKEAATLRQRDMTVPEAFTAINALETRARDLRTIGVAFRGFEEQQLALRDAAMTAEDRAQIDVMDKQAAQARGFLESSNPELQAMGRSMFERVLANQQAFTTTNEAQKIAAETALGSQRWQQFSALQDNYRQESAPFLEQLAAFSRIKAALATPDSPAGDQALVFNFMKMLDPGSAVLPGEYATASNTAGVPDAVLTLYNRMLREGQRLTPDQRKDFFRQAVEQMKNAQGLQSERDSRYIGQARDFELPEQMLRHFQLPRVDALGDPASFGSPQDATPATRDEQADSQATMIGRSVASGAKAAGRQALDFLGGVFDVSRPEASRDTDEYVTPRTDGATFQGFPVTRRGTVRGVYVPPSLRDQQ